MNAISWPWYSNWEICVFFFNRLTLFFMYYKSTDFTHMEFMSLKIKWSWKSIFLFFLVQREEQKSDFFKFKMNNVMPTKYSLHKMMKIDKIYMIKLTLSIDSIDLIIVRIAFNIQIATHLLETLVWCASSVTILYLCIYLYIHFRSHVAP